MVVVPGDALWVWVVHARSAWVEDGQFEARDPKPSLILESSLFWTFAVVLCRTGARV